jgi:hypothetical protein
MAKHFRQILQYGITMEAANQPTFSTSSAISGCLAHRKLLPMFTQVPTFDGGVSLSAVIWMHLRHGWNNRVGPNMDISFNANFLVPMA